MSSACAWLSAARVYFACHSAAKLHLAHYAYKHAITHVLRILSMSTTPDPTKEITITNNAGTPIVIMLPTTSTQTTDANGTMVYGQSLEVLTAVDGTVPVPD